MYDSNTDIDQHDHIKLILEGEFRFYTRWCGGMKLIINATDFYGSSLNYFYYYLFTQAENSIRMFHLEFMSPINFIFQLDILDQPNGIVLRFANWHFYCSLFLTKNFFSCKVCDEIVMYCIK